MGLSGMTFLSSILYHLEASNCPVALLLTQMQQKQHSKNSAKAGHSWQSM